MYISSRLAQDYPSSNFQILNITRRSSCHVKSLKARLGLFTFVPAPCNPSLSEAQHARLQGIEWPMRAACTTVGPGFCMTLTPRMHQCLPTFLRGNKFNWLCLKNGLQDVCKASGVLLPRLRGFGLYARGPFLPSIYETFPLPIPIHFPADPRDTHWLSLSICATWPVRLWKRWMRRSGQIQHWAIFALLVRSTLVSTCHLLSNLLCSICDVQQNLSEKSLGIYSALSILRHATKL